jgi:hypothetical protein
MHVVAAFISSTLTKPAPADFVRDGFSALALDSYPEAYAEFNQLMLAFIYPEVAAGPTSTICNA